MLQVFVLPVCEVIVYIRKLLLLSVVLPLTLACTPPLDGQEAAIKPNDALILQNIPPVPISIADRAARYTDYRTATMYGWHPQKHEILIGTRFADTVQVHQVAMPGGARTQVTFYGDRAVDASFQPHKGDYFLFRKDERRWWRRVVSDIPLRRSVGRRHDADRR